MLGSKKVLSFGISSLVAFGAVSLANDEPKSGVAQVTGEVKGVLELVSDIKSNNVGDNRVKVGAQKILDVLKEFESKNPKDVENIANIRKMISDFLGNVSNNVGDNKVKVGAQRILDMLREFESKDPKDVENIANIRKMISDFLGNVSNNVGDNKDLKKGKVPSVDVKTNEVAPVVEKEDSNDGAKANESKEPNQDQETKVEKVA